MQIRIIPNRGSPPTTGVNTAYLLVDNWNDYSFVTLFHVTAHDERGVFHTIGSVKIGFQGQTVEQDTHATVPPMFPELPPRYFSLGTDTDYYKNLHDLFSEDFRNGYLRAIRDMVFDVTHLDAAAEERVFSTSLLRSVSISAIDGQFKRVLQGNNPLTDFNFRFHRVAMTCPY